MLKGGVERSCWKELLEGGVITREEVGGGRKGIRVGRRKCWK